MKRPEILRLFFVCRACSTARERKSPLQPGGGEVVAKRKDVTVKLGLKEAWSKRTSQYTRTGSKAYGAGRTGK